jgi:CAAX protease family protein
VTGGAPAVTSLPLVLTEPVRQWPTAQRGAAATALAYAAAIVAAEALLAAFGPVPSVFAHALVLIALVNHWAFARTPGAPAALLVLALLPLLRILSVTMALDGLETLYQYALVGAPLLVAVVFVASIVRAAAVSERLRTWSWRREGPVALSGLPLGGIAFLLLGPNAPVERVTWANLLAGSLILLIFTGVLEELLFRGLLQTSLVELFGRGGILLTALLYAAAYLGTRSPLAIAFAAVLGVLFGWTVERTGSLLGVALAHGLLNVGALLVWPTLV